MRRKSSCNPQNHVPNVNFGRRALLKSSLLGGGVAAASGLFSGLIPAAALGVDPSSKYEGPIVETTAGKVRGIIQGGTHIFRGIPYGASTAGGHRVIPPPRPEAWDGGRGAFPKRPAAPPLRGPG